MERGNGSQGRVENYEPAINKGHHNVGSYPLRCCDLIANAFPPLI